MDQGPEREARDLKEANEIVKATSIFFAREPMPERGRVSSMWPLSWTAIRGAIVGWHAATVKDTAMVTTALKMALCDAITPTALWPAD